MRTIPCITLWQPWATWIALGWKPIESRNHNAFARLVGHEVGIHAGLRWDDNAMHVAREFLTFEQLTQTSTFYGIRGQLVAIAKVNEHRRLTWKDSEGALLEVPTKPAKWGLFLSDVRAAREPIPLKGQQGIWSHCVDFSRFNSLDQ